MSDPAVIGWDVGGAHLKAARCGAGGEVTTVLQLPCQLWQGIEHLEAAAGQALGQLGPAALNAVTMTGEMTDLFECREHGVRSLIETVGGILKGEDFLVYAGRAGLLTPAEAARRPDEVASANWLASAEVAALSSPRGLFVDIGSTTADVIPFGDGKVLARAYNDSARLIAGELVYTGVTRTPVFALTDRVSFRGEDNPVIPELFATTADVYRLCGTLPDNADLLPAADGQEKTVDASARRLARTLGRDRESAAMSDWRALAHQLAQAQQSQLAAACARVLRDSGLDGDPPLIGAGIGRFLVPDLARDLGRAYVDFSSLVPVAGGAREGAARCAPAVAVALLAARRR